MPSERSFYRRVSKAFDLVLAPRAAVRLFDSIGAMNIRLIDTWFATSVRRLTMGSILIGLIGSVGCQSTATIAEEGFEPVIARFMVEATPEISVAQTMELPLSRLKIPVYPSIGFSELDIADVELVRVDLGLCLLFKFTPEAARTLFRVSSANIGRRLVLSLNGKPMGARILEGPLEDGNLLIFVEMNDDELTDTAVNLKKTARKIQEAVASGKEPKL